MINLQLTIQEVDAILKHIEQSAIQIMEKIRSQAAPQLITQKPVAPPDIPVTGAGQAGSDDSEAVQTQQ